MASTPFSINDSFLIQLVTSSTPNQLSTVLQNISCNRNLYSQHAINHCLLYSSEKGLGVLVQALLAAGAHRECRDGNGNTPLMLSVLNDQVSTARLFLSEGADVNASNNAGDTALIVSTYFNTLHGLTKLLLERADIDLEHRNLNGFTALECATQAMNIAAMLLLINADAVCELPPCDNFRHFGVMNLLQTNLYTCAKNNGTLNVLKYFINQKNTRQPAILQAAEKRDLQSIHYITSIDISVSNYNADTYLTSLIGFLKSITQITISDIEYNIVNVLTHNYMLLRKLPSNKDLESKAVKLAVKIGHSAIIQKLCVSRFFISNEVVGHVAASGNNYLLNSIIRHGASVCKVNAAGQFQYPGSAVDRAVQHEQFGCATLLLNSAAFIDISLALKLAVESSKEKSLEFLLGKFPEKTKTALMSSNILHLAVFHGNVNIINKLLDTGVSVNVVHEERTPLMAAVDLEVVALLVSRGADVNAVIGSNFSFKLILHYFVSSQYFQYLKTKFTARDDVFIKFLQAALIKLLIHYGASIDSRDSFERTPLMVAAETADSCEIIKVLVGEGAEINKRSISDFTALHKAVQCGREDNVRCLLQSGADINAQSDTGENVFFLCYDNDLLKLLIENNANVNAEDINGNTALMQHIISEGIISTLIEAGSDVNHVNKKGKTPLLLAAKRVDPDILSDLLRSGADVNYSVTVDDREISAVTILMKCLRSRRIEVTECLRILLDHGLNSKTIPPSIIHALISAGRFSLIPRFISLGLAPIEVNVQWPIMAWIKSQGSVSPLDAALLMNNLKLAQFLVNIRFLTPKDVQMFCGKEEIKVYFHSERCFDIAIYLKDISRQPLSLETLCFVTVSQAFKIGPGRSDAIKTCGLPVPLREALLYEKVVHDMEDTYRSNQFLLKSSLHQAKLYSFDHSYMDVNFQYNIDFASDSDDD